jgi:ABC-2 type transport system permease protein
MSVSATLAILRKDLKSGPRSPMFLYALAFPVIATLLIQLVFGNLFEPEPRLGVVDDGSSAVARAVKDLDTISVSELDSRRELRREVENNNLDAGLYLPRGFDDDLREGRRPELQLFISGESLAKHRMVLGVITAGALRDVLGDVGDIAVEISQVGADAVPLSERLIPLLVMFAVLIAGVFVPAASLVEEKEKRTLAAVLVTPTTMADVMLAKGAVGLLLALAAGLVTLGLNRAFGGSAGALVLILVVAVTMAVAIGLIVGSLARNTNALFSVIKVGNALLMAPVLFFIWPGLPDWVAKLFPTYYFLNPLFEVAAKGAELSDVWRELAVAVLICAALVPVTWIVGRRMQDRLASS